MEKRALVVGGSNGLGLAIVHQLLKLNYKKVYIIDKSKPERLTDKRLEYKELDLACEDYSVLDSISDIDTLIITAGFGRVALFTDLTELEIINSFKVNALAASRIIKYYYDKIAGNSAFYTAVIGSIAGLLVSPFFSIYGATKAAP